VEALDPKKWDQSISPFRLPKGLRLVLADVDAGTNTPSFIRGILKWREEKPEESNEIWGKLFKANTRLVKALEHLRGLEGEEEYSEVLEAAAGLPIEQVRSFPLFSSLGLPLFFQKSTARIELYYPGLSIVYRSLLSTPPRFVRSMNRTHLNMIEKLTSRPDSPLAGQLNPKRQSQ
jgi:hypothetical protein